MNPIDGRSSDPGLSRHPLHTHSAVGLATIMMYTVQEEEEDLLLEWEAHLIDQT